MGPAFGTFSIPLHAAPDCCSTILQHWATNSPLPMKLPTKAVHPRVRSQCRAKERLLPADGGADCPKRPPVQLRTPLHLPLHTTWNSCHPHCILSLSGKTGGSTLPRSPFGPEKKGVGRRPAVRATAKSQVASGPHWNLSPPVSLSIGPLLAWGWDGQVLEMQPRTLVSHVWRAISRL